MQIQIAHINEFFLAPTVCTDVEVKTQTKLIVVKFIMHRSIPFSKILDVQKNGCFTPW